MAAFSRLPLRNDVSSFSFRTRLAGEDFVFVFRHNQREGCWYVDLLDTNNVAIVTGEKVVVGRLLFRACTDERLPAGAFSVVDKTQQDLDPGLFDLGSRVEVIFGEFA